ncbi:FAD-binding oxidoreductase [Nocardioides sp. GXZ039]|uniref:FAD-binding oxidoreductase n=1 Tax=Nocardioides sp. GXZ039 TaxID=3136018 RepID=UPI0030F42265
MSVHKSLDLLALDLDGVLTLPGDPEWDQARQAWNLAVDQQPVAVATVASVRDVQAVVTAARRAGLRVAPQSTGHNASPMGALADTILLRLSQMRGVSVDPSRRVARVEGGAQWSDVTSAAARHGLAALAGSSGDVGVTGYTLGGGVSWLARSHGLAANHVLAFEVVTAYGEPRRVDQEHDPDLFWALRGGGGSFAVVTAIEFALFPISEVYAGALFFPLEQAREVLNAWARWTDTVPAEITSIGRVVRFPAVPDVPPHLAGKSYTVVEAATTLDPVAADDLLAPLRALGASHDTFATIPVERLDQLNMDPPAPTPIYGDGWLQTDLNAEAVETVVRAVGSGVDTPLLAVDLRHLGGALNSGRGGGAIDGLPGAFLGFAVGITARPEAIDRVRSAVTGIQDGLEPWRAPARYLNFVEQPSDARSFYDPLTWARLRAFKAAYDPDDLIRSNHPIPAAQA